MDSAKPILSLQNVTKRFEGADTTQPVEVLRGVQLEVLPGQSLGIIGPSGSGKSTLLHIIGTLDRPTTGTVLLDGQDLVGLTDLRLAEFRNRFVGLVFQAHHLLPQCSVLENVLVPTLAQQDLPARQAAAIRARSLLQRIGLGDRLSHRPGQLSGGERQRVAVIRALINRPKLLLADEPTGALDRVSAEALGRLLVELNETEEVTLIVVTHALDLARKMNRVMELRDGLLQAWNPQSPDRNPAHA